jgi:hypothetical protein
VALSVEFNLISVARRSPHTGTILERMHAMFGPRSLFAPAFTAWSLLGLAIVSQIGAARETSSVCCDPSVHGTYVVHGTVPHTGDTHAQPVVQRSADWYIRRVDLNGDRLTQDIDYTVVDDGSNKGVVIFAEPLQRGDRVQISGPTLETGAHTGFIVFS